MSVTTKSRGRVLSRQQVQISASPVAVGEGHRCSHGTPQVHMKTDPQSGDVLEIHIRCGCGDDIVLECHYDGEVAVRDAKT